MARILMFALVMLGAYGVLRRLWPSVRSGRGLAAYLGLSALALGGWVVPMLLGKGMHGSLPWVGVPLKLFGSAWLVASLLLLVLGLPFALFRRPAPAPLLPGDVDLGRRRLLGRAVPMAAMATGAGGVVNGSSGFVVRRQEVRLKGLPPALDGFRIGQITDVHVGAFIDPDCVRRAVKVMNEEKVDLQVMTGDLIDDLGLLDETLAALEGCQAPHGMLSILGNHEHWRGLREIKAAYGELAKRGAPVKLLVDEAHVLEHAGQKVRVVGVDFPMVERLKDVRAGKEERMRRSAETGFKGVASDEFLVCLAHHPDFFPLAAEKGARLTLSGHTHGGQVAFFGVPVFGFAFKYALGRYRRGDNHLYVSGGTGHWLPFRVGIPTEVTLLTLRAA